MSIHIILGKPGSGKSFYATRRLIDELCDTNRNVVTNLPLRLDALNEYLQKRWPDRNLTPLQRIRVLTDEEMRYFWKFRGQADVAPPELALWGAETNEQKKNALAKDLDTWAKTPSVGDEGRGVAYFLDEAHIPFNARAWATVATAALFYLSQHRKLGDIVWPITQAPSNLDKQFRSVAEDFTRVRNEYLAKWGPFKGRGRFVRKTYLSEPTGPNVEPFETGSFQLDGIESCYDTARGIGVHGSKADVGRRAKGIPIMWVVPGALLLAALCVVVPWMLGKVASKVVAGDVPEKAVASQTAQNTSVPPSSIAPVVKSSVSQANGAPASVYVRGYVVRGSKINVVLSDGRTLTEKDAELSAVERHSAVVNGEKLFLRPPETIARAEGSSSSKQGLAPRSVEAEPKTSSPDYLGESLFPASPDVLKPFAGLPSSQPARAPGRGAGAAPRPRATP